MTIHVFRHERVAQVARQIMDFTVEELRELDEVLGKHLGEDEGGTGVREPRVPVLPSLEGAEARNLDQKEDQ